MEIGVIGISHHNTPVDIREKVYFTHSQKVEAMNDILDLGVEEVIILSTCNRSEIYFTSVKLSEDMQKVKKYLTTYSGEPEIESYVFEKYENEAIAHIFYVSCGFDSAILGEDQILGQVKEAQHLAMEIGASKKILNKLFRDAIHFSKRMKNEFKISENPLSISSIGVKFLKERMAGFQNQKIMVIGTGEIGKLIVTYLLEEAVKDIYVTNRTHCKMEAIQEEFPSLHTIPYNKRYDALPMMDVVISATSSPHTIFREDKLLTLNKPLVILDLAVPRDIDVEIGKLDGVQLFDIDHIKEIHRNNLAYRNEIAGKIEKMIEEEVQIIADWILKTKVDPVIQSFHELCNEVVEDTMSIINEKIPLNHRHQVLMEKLLYSSLKRVIRTPIKELKTLEKEGEIKAYKEMINRLFNF